MEKLALPFVTTVILLLLTGCPDPEPEKDTTLPHVTITSPAPNTVLSGIVSVKAVANDNVGIRQVQFLVNASVIGTSTDEPHEVNWNTSTLSPGFYSLFALAEDLSGNESLSQGVLVEIGCTDVCDPTCTNYNPNDPTCASSCSDVCNPDCSNYDPNDSSCNTGCTDVCNPDCSNYDPNDTSCVGLVNITLKNTLLLGIVVSYNDEVVGSIDALGSGTFSRSVRDKDKLSWEVINPVVANTTRTIGDEMGGSWELEETQNDISVEVDNIIGNNWFFLPNIDNETSERLLMAVNFGLSSENKCDCTISPNTQTAIGYYRFFSNSNVRAYKDGSNYTGGWLEWKGFTSQNLEPKTGRINLTATSAPGGRLDHYAVYVPIEIDPGPLGNDQPLSND